MADEHLMHQQPICPYDRTPVVFTSLQNPRRKARYRLSCFYCGRQAEIDWPPPRGRTVRMMRVAASKNRREDHTTRKRYMK